MLTDSYGPVNPSPSSPPPLSIQVSRDQQSAFLSSGAKNANPSLSNTPRSPREGLILTGPLFLPCRASSRSVMPDESNRSAGARVLACVLVREQAPESQPGVGEMKRKVWGGGVLPEIAFELLTPRPTQYGAPVNLPGGKDDVHPPSQPPFLAVLGQSEDDEGLFERHLLAGADLVA